MPRHAVVVDETLGHEAVLAQLHEFLTGEFPPCVRHGGCDGGTYAVAEAG